MHADPDALMPAWMALFVGHYLGDYWTQSDYQALTKGEYSHAGRRACAAHVASLTAVQFVLLVVVLSLAGAPLHPVALAVGVAVNAGSHYWAARRETLRGLVLATEPLTHKIKFFNSGARSVWIRRSTSPGPSRPR